MANFNIAIGITLIFEGGYVSNEIDSGGETYKGVSRNRNQDWSGWKNIDLKKSENGFPQNLEDDEDLQSKVYSLYKTNYWDKIRGDDIEDQSIANSIFDFGVNAGIGTSSKLAQTIVGTTPDGIIGPKSLEEINTIDERLFLCKFALGRTERYMSICKNNIKDKLFLFGWIRRTLNFV
ncbi:MAG: N-acetylmuramidase [Candidatus Cloacimonadota bacterium]|nr:MAG: N-acetylmuramidase [Candidatus Cloacimonadota bacterium]PIE78110.1 MAG: N-acetylmuramidase [Candidatus Delongbacteria bacterium]